MRDADRFFPLIITVASSTISEPWSERISEIRAPEIERSKRIHSVSETGEGVGVVVIMLSSCEKKYLGKS